MRHVIGHVFSIVADIFGKSVYGEAEWTSEFAASGVSERDYEETTLFTDMEIVGGGFEALRKGFLDDGDDLGTE